jgi:hypothetical protein
MYYDVGAKAQIYLLKGFTRLFFRGGGSFYFAGHRKPCEFADCYWDLRF